MLIQGRYNHLHSQQICQHSNTFEFQRTLVTMCRETSASRLKTLVEYKKYTTHYNPLIQNTLLQRLNKTTENIKKYILSATIINLILRVSHNGRYGVAGNTSQIFLTIPDGFLQFIRVFHSLTVLEILLLKVIKNLTWIYITHG